MNHHIIIIPRLFFSQPLNDRCVGRPAALADRLQAKSLPRALQLVHQRRHELRPSGAQWVAQGAHTAVHIQPAAQKKAKRAPLGTLGGANAGKKKPAAVATGRSTRRSRRG